MKTITRRFSTCLHLLMLLVLTLALSGCESLKTFQSNPTVQFAETEAIKLAAAFFSNGGSVDNAWSISQGINLIGDVARFSAQKNLPDPNAAAAFSVAQAAKSFADNPKAVAGLASSLGAVVERAAPQTPSQRSAVVLAVANGIQKAASAATP